jgi:hypothetical protein
MSDELEEFQGYYWLVQACRELLRVTTQKHFEPHAGFSNTESSVVFIDLFSFH